MLVNGKHYRKIEEEGVVIPSSSLLKYESKAPKSLQRDACKCCRHIPQSLTIAIIIAMLLFLFGVGLIAYPYASSWLNQIEQNKVVKNQEEAVSNISKEDLSAHMDAAQDYNKRLQVGRVLVTDPFDPSITQTSNEEYESLLNISDDGVMGQIIIPSINVSMPIYHDVTGKGMDHGVGHMPTTSLPVGGESTHCVLAGHTGLPSAKVFDNLDQLKEGDWFIIKVLGEDHAYRVTSVETVLPEETGSLTIVKGKDQVTLVTCTPYGVNTHRLLVHAERCDVPEEWNEKRDTSMPPESRLYFETPLFILTLVGLVIGISLIIGLIFIRRRYKKKE